MRRCAGRVLVLAVILLATALATGIRPAAAAAISGPSTAPASPAVGIPCLPSIWCDPLGGATGAAADAIGKAMFDSFVAWVADGATAVLGHVSVALNSTTQVDLGAAWFTSHVDLMRALAVAILLPLVLIGLIGAVIYRDFGRLVRAAGVFVPVAIVGGAVAVQLTALALKLTDQLTFGVAGDMKSSTETAVETIVAAAKSLTTPLTAGAGGLLTVVVLLLVIAGAIFIWIELLIRSASIYVVVLFLPVALSGLVWPVTARWTRRMIESLAALILSKFVIVAVISLAADMIAEAQRLNGADKLSTLMTGAALLLMAAFAPFAVLRLIPIAEAGVIGHLEGMERRPVAATARAVTTAAGLAMNAAGVVGGGDVERDAGAGTVPGGVVGGGEQGGDPATPGSLAAAGDLRPPGATSRVSHQPE